MTTISTDTTDPRGETTRVFCIDLRNCTDTLMALEAETPRLSDSERQRAARLVDGQAAQRWLAAHVALRLVLERALGAGLRRVPYQVSPGGKPGLAGSPIVFSLSHGGGWSLIAVAQQGPLGVDIESVRPIRFAGDRRAAIESAGALLSRQPLPDDTTGRFLQAWVRLEALAKAGGDGMAKVLTRAGAFGGRRGQGAGPDLLPRSIVVADLALGEGHYAAIARGASATGVEVCAMPTDGDSLRAFPLGMGLS